MDFTDMSEQNQTWRQPQSIDSGFASGTSSQAQSSSSRNDGFILPQFAIEHENHQNVVQQQTFGNNHTDFFSYEGDGVSLAVEAIPLIIKLLNDEDKVVVNRAAIMIHKLSKKEICLPVIVESTEMIATLLKILSTSNDPETIQYITGALHNITSTNQGLLSTMNLGGIGPFINLLSSEDQTTLFYVITMLHNLLLNQEEAKALISFHGGVEKLVKLLRHTNVKFLAVVVDCLKILAYKNVENKITILANDGPAELLRIMRTYSYEKLLWITAGVLKVLSVCLINKQEIVTAGGINILAMQLYNSSPRLVQNCLWTLRNLSDVGMKELHYGLLYCLIEILGSNNIDNVTCAAGILSNLTCNNEQAKTFVCQMNGIQTLIKVIHYAGNCEEITEPAISALRHLTSHHRTAEMALNTVRLSNGFPVVVKLLINPSSGWPLIKAVIGLILNLALCPANCEPLRQHGVIPRLVQLFIRSYQDIQRESSAAIDGVKMEEILQGTVGILQIFAHEPVNQVIIQELTPILDQLLYHRNVKIQCAAARILSELATFNQRVPALPENFNSSNHSNAPLPENHHFTASEDGWGEDLASILTGDCDQLFQDIEGLDHSTETDQDQLPSDMLPNLLDGSQPESNVNLSNSGVEFDNAEEILQLSQNQNVSLLDWVLGL